jgi:tryptophanyl-tRNA synthetase
LLSCTTGQTVESLIPKYENKMYGHLKGDVAEAVVAMLTPIQAEYNRIRSDKNYLHAVLQASALKAREKASVTLAKTYEALGFVPQ